MMGQNVVEGFQGLGKHGRKKGTLKMYDIYGTHQGGCGTYIEPVNDTNFFFPITSSLGRYWKIIQRMSV